MKRLTAKGLSDWRAATLEAQGGRCALCGMAVSTADPAVADHHHTTGQLRGVLHRSCNALLGKVENNHKRYGVRTAQHLAAMLKGMPTYLLQRIAEDAPLYPTHRTADEKREKRNAAARKKRAAAKKETNATHVQDQPSS